MIGLNLSLGICMAGEVVFVLNHAGLGAARLAAPELCGQSTTFLRTAERNSKSVKGFLNRQDDPFVGLEAKIPCLQGTEERLKVVQKWAQDIGNSCIKILQALLRIYFAQRLESSRIFM